MPALHNVAEPVANFGEQKTRQNCHYVKSWQNLENRKLLCGNTTRLQNGTVGRLGTREATRFPK
jgi:hypothetical protein